MELHYPCPTHSRPFLPCIPDVRRPALTVELPYRNFCSLPVNTIFSFEPMKGLEPPTCWLRNSRSTYWATQAWKNHRFGTMERTCTWNHYSLGSGVHHHFIGVTIKVAVWLAMNLSSFPTDIASKPSHPHIECLICGDVGVRTQVYHTFLKVSTKSIISIYVIDFSKFVLVVGLEPTTSTL